MKQNKPKVFIGSSREAIPYATAVHEDLRYVAEVTPWFAGTFNPLKYTMEDLETQLDYNDFAVFICSPDDIINIRGATFLITRDNTLFEMGLFWGKLRRGRVFYLIPDLTPKEISGMKIEDYHLLSDLVGINPLLYEIRSTPNPAASVSIACGRIKSIIQELGFYLDPKIELEKAQLRQKERDAVSLFLLKLAKELIQSDKHRLYEFLTDALRSVYAIHPGFNIDGVGVWKKVGTEGLKHVAGKVGNVNFYSFGANDGLEENHPDRVLVIDCYIKGEEIIFLTKEHLFKTYLICYPIGKELVLTVTITGNEVLTDEETVNHIFANEELIKTINYLFWEVLLND
ncbi:TIR domain-containing protein [Sporosarcina highlanderae]|uniref:Nucleotide-binding protein n=1 Tax=Sporosarcina highlanderae TaxID=3035916 RepID=A0ABT8JUZ2_9BACL|nr:TIR domain-containing protein [Sporosarcina highlanderae]MDN4608192.1 nucleotide-binding protein [Sporosarcina highlanderae]